VEPAPPLTLSVWRIASSTYERSRRARPTRKPSGSEAATTAGSASSDPVTPTGQNPSEWTSGSDEPALGRDELSSRHGTRAGRGDGPEGEGRFRTGSGPPINDCGIYPTQEQGLAVPGVFAPSCSVPPLKPLLPARVRVPSGWRQRRRSGLPAGVGHVPWSILTGCRSSLDCNQLLANVEPFDQRGNGQEVEQYDQQDPQNVSCPASFHCQSGRLTMSTSATMNRTSEPITTTP
jgi:hypothetical protein